MSMIPDEQRSLLTAAVDGELSPAEARALKTLLGESADARDLFAKLKADSDRLRNLPQLAPPAGLPARIMASLPLATPRPIIVPPTRRDRSRDWVPLALAASVLIGLAASSFWFFTREAQQPDTAANGNPVGTESARGEGRGHLADVLPPETGQPPSAPQPRDAVNNLAHDHPQPIERPESIPEPRAVSRPIAASPLIPKTAPFEMVQVRLPFLASVAEFDREDVRQKFVAELGREPASRIDLFVKDVGRGAETFLAAARASGVTVFTDATAAERIKRRTPGSFVVYAECLTVAELRDLFAHVAADDAKVTHRNFASVHVNPATAADQKELKDVLGFDPGPWKRQPTPSPAATDPKPISAGTGDQVAKSVSTSGSKTIDKPAALATHGPTSARTPPAMSKELKQYAEKRGERKPHTVPVLIVIRVPG